ncbi:ABC transporter ATP-binding protein [Nocardia blacklockiae]|uniref:ABC transporter ATP-binding protein n=1 Tax=Nocardia blacklockiae TaxID=480036 RepID=UPI00189359DD|nr:ABC transporter ATP-binding protein [Nocardia blacklockiae]MBF6175826.1 ABC transporter ATP-binding protein [Nocardia blacklockiae]
MSIRALRFSFGTVPVLRDIDLDIAPGEIIAVVGASGSGKSTLLRLVAGLERPGGAIRVDGVPVTGIDARSAVVFQEPRLLPWRDVSGNVALGLPAGTPRAEGRAAVRRWLEVVGLEGFGNYRPRQISGGMAQRAALARALVRRPGVLLLDEPFAALDALTRLRMQNLLADVHREVGTTMLLVTHDIDEALTLADRVVLLEPGNPGAAAGFTIGTVLDVPAERPRDRFDPAFADLRTILLDRLGVPGRSTVKEHIR